ncbi:MAG: OmpH family outer membrane protein [Kiritimatiellae bacterium]|jgi:outer membrane protein|nr:OmpH family outer membrane protein [Kiritimatiellia bacterium]
MKKVFMILTAVMVAGVLVAAEKTAVVNMVDLVRFHPSRERDRKLMEETEKEFQAKLDKQRDRFEELRTGYEKLVKESRNPALNEKARAEAEDKAMKHREVLAQADRDLRAEMQKLQSELGDLDSRLLRQVTGDIRSVITKYSQEKKFNVVLDSTTMAYFNPKLEITDDVLTRMGVDPKARTAKKKVAEPEKK